MHSFLRNKHYVDIWSIFERNFESRTSLLWHWRMVSRKEISCSKGRWLLTRLDALFTLSFLWKWNKAESKIIAYQWTGKNEYMILSEPDFIAIGGG